jgi:hypothetical protein
MFALPVKQKQEGGLKQKALSILGSAVLAESFTVTNGIKERKISEKGTERFLYFFLSYWLHSIAYAMCLDTLCSPGSKTP